MNIPAQPQMRFLGTFGGVVAGAVRMTGDSPWEMHPGGDECLHLLSGAIDVVVEHEGLSQVIDLRPGGGCVVPRGAWHRQLVREPGDLLFITPAAGTQYRGAGQNVNGERSAPAVSDAAASRPRGRSRRPARPILD